MFGVICVFDGFLFVVFRFETFCRVDIIYAFSEMGARQDVVLLEYRFALACTDYCCGMWSGCLLGLVLSSVVSFADGLLGCFGFLWVGSYVFLLFCRMFVFMVICFD